ncbi:MAG: hypothetical protein ACKVH8_17185 [Pirellulales bacterium]|jgi:hypothetical protein
MSVGEMDLLKCSTIPVGPDLYITLNSKDTTISLHSHSELRWLVKTELLREINFVSFWCTENKLLLCDNYGLDIFSIVIETGVSEVVLTLQHRDETGVYRTKFVEVDQGCLLVYERGLISFDLNCKVRWEIDIPMLDTLFQGAIENEILFYSEFEGETRYSLYDGMKIND